MSDTPQVGNWGEYQRLVLAQLESHNSDMSKMDVKMNDIRDKVGEIGVEIRTLKAQQDQFLPLLERITKLETQLVSIEQNKADNQRVANIESKVSNFDTTKGDNRWWIGFILIIGSAILSLLGYLHK